MNILYLSHLSGASYAGPTYSVPKQIEAQSKIDCVFWYNAVEKSTDDWKNIPYYHDLTEYPRERIAALPAPFNRPDMVVVECFYNMFTSPLMRELMRGNLPYIIVPRGELTKQAQKRKKWKKSIANLLGCRRYARKAAAIQYLTAQEYQDAGDVWNAEHLIIPNGVEMPEITKRSFSENQIKCVSIGRISPYHKGLDLLIEACAGIKDELIKANCRVTICGPDSEGKVAELSKMVSEYGLQEVISFRDGVYGEEKRDLLLNSDVFLITSRFEGHPIALIEALSYGLPVVATTGSNMREEIETADAGWTADNDADSIMEALKAAIDSQRKYPEISEKSIALAKNYKWESLAEKSHACFTHLIRREINE